eukprot:6780990-Pyramimonas_sp.AAC.1
MANSDFAQHFLEQSLLSHDTDSGSGESPLLQLDNLVPCLYQDLEESKSTKESQEPMILHEADDAPSLEVVVDAAEDTNHNLWAIEVGYPPPYHGGYRVGYRVGYRKGVYNITLFYGSSCANNSKGALNTPDRV